MSGTCLLKLFYHCKHLTNIEISILIQNFWGNIMEKREISVPEILLYLMQENTVFRFNFYHCDNEHC